MKPASSEVEMDLSLDVDSKNYDPDCGDRLNMTKQVCSHFTGSLTSKKKKKKEVR